MSSVVVNNTLHVNFLGVKTVRWAVLAFLCVFFILPTQVKGQKVYADNYIGKSGNVPSSIIDALFPPYNKLTAINGGEAALGGDEQYARLLSSAGLIVDIGAYKGYVEIQYDEIVPANTPTYIRVNGDAGLLEQLLGGTLGELLSGVAGSILGKQIIKVEAKNSNGNVLFDRSTLGGLGADDLKMVKDRNGNYHLKFTPNVPYQRLKITNLTTALAGLGVEFYLDVYEAFYFGNECNYAPEFISYYGSGINLDALNLGGGIVEHPENAIDDDPSTASSVSPGLLNVLGSSTQQFYFTQASAPTDEVMVTLSGDPSLVNIELLSNVSFKAFNGDLQVFEQDLGALSAELLGLIKLDLLGLLGEGEAATFPVSPGVPFDRFEISVGSFLDVDVGEALNVHEVERTVGMPDFGGVTGNNYSICEGQSLSVSPQSYGGASLRWYEAQEGGTPIGTTESLDIDEVTEDKTYYVSSVDECSGLEVASARVAVEVDALAVPEEEDYEALPSQATYGEGEVVVLEPNLESSAGIEDPQFNWSMAPDGVPAITDEWVVDKGDHTVTYRLRPDGALEIEGLQPEDEIDEVYLVLQNGDTGCKAIEAVEQVFVILPISGMRFEGYAKGDGNYLNWEFSARTPLMQLIVQRAGPELQWYEIGDLSLSGDHIYGGVFDFMDETPVAGVNFYRIKTVPFDGKEGYSAVIRLDRESKSHQVFSIFPNPVVDTPVLRNHTSKEFNHITVQVIGQNGEVVDDFTLGQLLSGEAKKLHGAKSLKPGVYVYMIYTQGHTQRIKVIW
ncbi:hypothetical protein DN752_16455 [Echinicola strongylocentroti]|uniref:Ig-like domain-containing protein n=1 Tax=Echinicola strongylocentroti TaxID=1795355 RepID=A0A2Z4IKW2_9BACT|nr:T9SS type A sorting domain-containing protein [Echinicola strongylocentroti]AWW31585.1 hypothetical protein DN752_16455 [Echinicola strongylocentroti]